MNAFEFEITIQGKSGDSSWPIVVRCKQPDGLTIHAKETLQLSQNDLNQLIQQQENEKEYGILLGQALFAGSVRETFVRALSKSSQDCRLRVLLSIEAADDDVVKILHWERLCAPIEADGSWHLLARNQRVPFSLYIPTIIDRRFPPIGRRDLRSLILVASPTNIGKYQLAPFDVEAALTGVKEALGDIPHEVLANDVAGALGPPTLQELSKQLTQTEKPYTLLHFICHGRLLDSGETVLYWADAKNQGLPVTAKDLIEELKNIGNYQKSLPHFAFLCTCESADPRAEGALGGLAQRLVRNLGMPAVVAMTRKVSVETGLTLGQNFYQRLRESGEVDIALQQATAGLGKRHDITVPALFSRLGGRPLFSDRLDDRDLTDEEIDYGIEKLQQLLEERAPNASVLKQRFRTQVEKLKDTQGAESRTAREGRQRALVELNNLCDQVLEISFDALAALGKEPPEYKAECPFPGLSSFSDEKYHKFFFGRDELIKDLQKELEKDNFLAVIGTSGSGKSSVVLAGLIPKLKQEEPNLQSVYMTPSNEPLKQLKRQLEQLLKVPEHYSVLVVDQFEEVFTLCEDKAHQQEFIEKLLHLAQRRRVVITMRADFLGECTFYPELRKRIETRQKLVGPMEPAELIAAMKMQADSGGLRFEAGLSHSILNDVQGEPGAMPLLQYALQELWKRRRGRWLCDEEYQGIGRVQQAIAKTASDFYNSLPALEQEQVQNIFLRLTCLDKNTVQGEKRRNTRQRVELEDLVPNGGNLAETKKLVQQLASEGARLVVTSRNETTGKEQVEVAHEALIRHWPTLQNWLEQNRSDLQLRENINQATEDWHKHKDKPDQEAYLIHQGGRLENAEMLLKHPKFVHLNQEEAEYVSACIQLRDRIRKQEEQRRRRQLKAAAGTALIMGLFALLAGYQWRKADIHQVKAFLQSTEVSLASNQTLDARIGSIRAEKAFKNSFWQTLWPDSRLKDQVLDKLTTTSYAGQEINRLELVKSGELSWIQSIAFIPDGRLVIADSKGTLRLWDINTQKSEELLKDPSIKKDDYLSTVQISPDGQKLAVFKSDGNAYLWDIKTKKQDKLEKSDSEKLYEVAFSPDSQILSGRSSNAAYLWDTTTKKLKNFRPDQDKESSANFSPDGKFLVIIRGDNTVDLEDVATKQRYPLLTNDSSKKKTKDKIKVYSTVFSPDSQFLAVIPEDRGSVRLWNIKTKEWNEAFKEEPYQDGEQYVDISNVNFTPDSQILSIMGANGTIWLRDNEGRWLSKLRSSVGSIAFRQTDQLLATTDATTVHLWDLSQRRVKVMEAKDSINSIVFSPDGQRLVGASEDNVYLWNTEGKKLRLPQKPQGKVEDVAISPYGQILIATTNDGIVRLWGDEDKPLITSSRYQGKLSAAISPDGQQLAVARNDGSVQIVDTQGNKQHFKLQGKQEIEKTKLVFSPNGQNLAVYTLDKDENRSIWLGNIKEQMFVKLPADQVRVAFSPDGQRLVTVGLNGTIQLRDTKGQPLPDKLVKSKVGVLSVALSPKDQLLATGSWDGTTQLWSINGQQLGEFQGHQGYVNRVAFSPNGKLLATTGEDHTVRLWQLGEMNELLKRNCDWVRDYLKNSEADLSESDRHLCDGISTASSSPKK